MTHASMGLLHPGAMGVTVGRAARAGGHQVSWVSAGRSPATRARAAAESFADRSLEQLVREADVIVSVCPPHAALELAREVADHGFDGVYVDANAVAPATTMEVGEAARAGGADFVDGGIVGPPADRPETTRLYLSGAKAGEVARLFEGSALRAIEVGPMPYAASALKMAYAAYTKGSAALLLAVRALAASAGVEGELLQEWQWSQKGLAERSANAAAGTAPKAWRFSGEMREIAATFQAAGLPGGFHEAAEDVYDRLASFKDASEPPDVDRVVAALLRDR